MKPFRILFLVVLFGLNIGSAKADMGPKPEMNFRIEYLGGRLLSPKAVYQLCFTDASAEIPSDTLHENNQRGPEGFRCEGPNECRSLAYSYDPYHRLMFVFENDTLISNVFTKSAFRSRYSVTVYDDRVIVKNQTPWFFREESPFPFIRAALVTLSVELSALLVLLFIFGYPMKKQFMTGVFLANVISLPLFWFGIMGLFNSAGGWIGGELFVVLFEALSLWFFIRKAEKFGKILLLVFFLNFLSVLAGGAVLFLSVIIG